MYHGEALIHLAPVPLALCVCRRHLGPFLAGLQLLPGLHHLAGVILTGWAVPAEKEPATISGVYTASRNSESMRIPLKSDSFSILIPAISESLLCKKERKQFDLFIYKWV